LDVGVPRPAEPNTRAGDVYWEQRFGVALSITERAPSVDLDHFVRAILSQLAPALSLTELQLCRGGPMVTQIRHIIIKRAVVCGYRRADIARKLNISVSTVSKIVKAVFEDSRGGTEPKLFS
jgi:DNA-binding NarL/FixJ family response regulator